ncbi:MAG TPA: hypothetical protein VHA33_08465 [Candidatus Angelobacter sp.]|jgi:hypothetical protein|nr:hypothetical protein [Candidatus Angelobacter sp.]
MATQYDPSILQQFADQLYKQAKSIVVSTALRYGFTTFLFTMTLSGSVSFLGDKLSPAESDRLAIYSLILWLAALCLPSHKAGLSVKQKHLP